MKGQILALTTIMGFIGFGLYFGLRNPLKNQDYDNFDTDQNEIVPTNNHALNQNNSNAEILSIDVNDPSSDIVTEIDDKITAIQNEIKYFADWKIKSFNIDKYSFVVTTKIEDLEQVVCTKYKLCTPNDSLNLIYNLNEIGVNLLAYYALHPTEKKYLDSVEKIIKVIFEQKLKGYGPSSTNPTIPLQLMYNIGILPILFEYISWDKAYDHTQMNCHKFIINLIPKIPSLNEKKFNTETMLFIQLRILTNYRFDRENFEQDSNASKMNEFITENQQMASKPYKNDSYDSILRNKLYLALMTD